MNDDQIKKLKEELIEATELVVKLTVNGKIDRIDKKLDAYIVTDIQWKEGVESYMTTMLPVKDGVHTIQSINKFLKWLGLPALGALIAWLYIK